MVRTSELKYLGLFLGFHLKWQLPFESNVFYIEHCWKHELQMYRELFSFINLLLHNVIFKVC